MNAPSGKILLIDDEPEVLHGLARALRGLEVTATESPGRALEIMRDDGPFSVVVSDLCMPVMDGVRLLAEAQRIDSDTVRVMLTGVAGMEDVINAVNQGHIYRFLAKPCADEDFRRAVEDSLEQHERILAQRRLAAARKMQQTLDKVIVGFVRILESRDPYTAGHQRRVAQLAQAIAQRLGLADEENHQVRLAAMLHDLGKVYVPAEFLNKPGPLSKLELELIHAHPAVAYEILAPLGFDWPLAEVVREHHERLDGSGYPQGLKGEAIHLHARIIAVADVVEAISSHRPYRPAQGLDVALAEIKTGRGKLYDPAVVDCCLKLIGEESWRFLPE